jgi:hypothetical protein
MGAFATSRSILTGTGRALGGGGVRCLRDTSDAASTATYDWSHEPLPSRAPAYGAAIRALVIRIAAEDTLRLIHAIW